MLLIDRSWQSLSSTRTAWPAFVWAPDNFGAAKDNIPYFTLFSNSIIITAGTILIVLACASALAFALSNFSFRGRNGLYVLMILMLVVPLPTAFIRSTSRSSSSISITRVSR